MYDRKPHTFNAKAAFRILNRLEVEMQSTENLLLLLGQLGLSCTEVIQALLYRAIPGLEVSNAVFSFTSQLVTDLARILYERAGDLFNKIKGIIASIFGIDKSSSSK